MSSILDFGAPAYDELQHHRRLVESLLPRKSRTPESAAKDKRRMMAQILAQKLAGNQSHHGTSRPLWHGLQRRGRKVV